MAMHFFGSRSISSNYLISSSLYLHLPLFLFVLLSHTLHTSSPLKNQHPSNYRYFCRLYIIDIRLTNLPAQVVDTMSDPTRRHVSAMNSALEPHRGVGHHPQAANTDDGHLARRACTAAIMQLTGGRGSTLLTTNHNAGAMTHPQVSHIYTL